MQNERATVRLRRLRQIVCTIMLPNGGAGHATHTQQILQTVDTAPCIPSAA